MVMGDYKRAMGSFVIGALFPEISSMDSGDRGDFMEEKKEVFEAAIAEICPDW